MNLAELDLNLLVTLDALLEERHIGRTATRLNQTPAQLNAALNKLRRLVGDPLLVRTQGKLVRTPRAEELHSALRSLLGQLGQVLAPPTRFTPVTSRQTFTLASSDYAEFVLLPKLIARLGELAPGVRVAVRHAAELPEAELAEGRVDLVLGHFEGVPATLKSQTLFTERLVCVLRRNHPKIKDKGTLSAESFNGASHVMVTDRGGTGWPVDHTLQKAQLERHVALKVPSFQVAPMVAAQTDLVATLPARVALHFAKILPLKVLEPPAALQGYAVSQVWHPRSEASPAVEWLRGVVSALGLTV
jgi:DNA-binding transcriptional LysR family regulator